MTPWNCRLPGSSIHGIFQARVLGWVAISFSRGSSQPRDQTQASHIVGRHFTVWDTRKGLHLIALSGSPYSSIWPKVLSCSYANHSDESQKSCTNSIFLFNCFKIPQCHKVSVTWLWTLKLFVSLHFHGSSSNLQSCYRVLIGSMFSNKKVSYIRV